MRIMKKTMMKMMTALTAVTALFAMTVSGTVSAYNTPSIGTGYAHQLTTSTQTAEIPIQKDIIAFNSDPIRGDIATTILPPKMTYQYEISIPEMNNDVSITTLDQNDASVTLAVHPGILGSVTMIDDKGDLITTPAAFADSDYASGKLPATITFGNSMERKKTNQIGTREPVDVSTDYTFKSSMDITVDAGKIYNPQLADQPDYRNKPGVYRYQITETTAASVYTASGVTDGGAPDDLYLDVYVKYNETNDNLVVYGYVLLRSTAEGASANITYVENSDETIKTEGFVSESEGDDNGDNSVNLGDLKSDRYETYNLKVGKTVSGDLASRQHRFPFEITLTNDTVTNNAAFCVNNMAGIEAAQQFTGNTWTSADANIDRIDFKMAHGDQVTFIGLPAGTKVLVKEKNDTNDTYSVSAKDSNENIALQVKLSDAEGSFPKVKAEHNKTVEMAAPFAITSTLKAEVITFNNDLSDVSVTGLVFDIAPFILITAVGAALLAFYFYNRRKTQSDDKI